MSSLLQPIVRFVSRLEIELCQPWQIDTRVGLLRVLAGARSDGASVPEFIDGLAGFHRYEGDTFPAAFAHDMLYAGELCTREEADLVLYDLLIANGVSPARAGAYLNAVRVGGAAIWAKHTPAGIMASRRRTWLLPLQPN